VALELFEQLASLVEVAGGIEVTQPLFDPICDGDLRVRIAEL
jgi:hypothetical protein